MKREDLTIQAVIGYASRMRAILDEWDKEGLEIKVRPKPDDEPKSQGPMIYVDGPPVADKPVKTCNQPDCSVCVEGGKMAIAACLNREFDGLEEKPTKLKKHHCKFIGPLTKDSYKDTCLSCGWSQEKEDMEVLAEWLSYQLKWDGHVLQRTDDSICTDLALRLMELGFDVNKLKEES